MLNGIEGVYRKAVVLQAQNQMTEAHKLLQKLLTYCQKLKNIEIVISVLLSVTELYWRSFVPDYRHACAPGSSGPLLRIPITILGLRNCAQLGLCPAHP